MNYKKLYDYVVQPTARVHINIAVVPSPKGIQVNVKETAAGVNGAHLRSKAQVDIRQYDSLYGSFLRIKNAL